MFHRQGDMSEQYFYPGQMLTTSYNVFEDRACWKEGCPPTKNPKTKLKALVEMVSDGTTNSLAVVLQSADLITTIKG